ncbi:vanin-like protein 1 [Bombyx mori]|uniref:Vanin C-terminal domain-containing protein n=1 Tax=Bombyx mori TaxID=7091 RepID=A0A8R2M9T4_BOMMO|nr:vanin-like protein 1 [Bombyx mori]
MNFVYLLVFLTFGTVLCVQDSYKAASIKSANENVDFNSYLPLIVEAGKSDVDILVLPAQEKTESADKYEEAVKNISDAAKKAGLYIAAHLYEGVQCQNKKEIVRSNIVFDREGKTVSVYKKPMNNLTNCTSVDSEGSFKTDFGVTFGLLMGEDLALYKPETFGGLKNFLVLGGFVPQIPILGGPQLLQSWAYVNRANIISPAGIYASGSAANNGNAMIVADLNKEGADPASPPIMSPSQLQDSPAEDLSLYAVKPLDLESASRGLQETVCHGQLCCQFKIKTKLTGTKPLHTYSLAALRGDRAFSRGQRVGVQSCAIFACPGPDGDTCVTQIEWGELNVIFEQINISGNFSKSNTALYPMVVAADTVPLDNFKFDTKVTDQKLASIELTEARVFSAGIFGRDFDRDANTKSTGENNAYSNFYDYIFNDDVLGIIDYVWIRLRILIFVVSIYILEMI